MFLVKVVKSNCSMHAALYAKMLLNSKFCNKNELIDVSTDKVFKTVLAAALIYKDDPDTHNTGAHSLCDQHTHTKYMN